MEKIQLWENTPLFDESIEQTAPCITPYFVDKQANRGAVIVVPGGGYAHLAMDHEGHQFAQWLNYLGYQAFVLQYRLAPYHAPCQHMDLSRAIRYVRYHAEEWNIDPKRIGIIGFSAGGHLCSSVVTHFDNGTDGDAIDAVSNRPDFAMLIYPVITSDPKYAHMGSFRNLLGEQEHNETLRTYWSSEKQVTPETPPIFLAHAANDTAVPVENSFLFASACRQNNVPVELHVYPEGSHGFGFGRHVPHTWEWSHNCEKWLRIYG